MVWVENQREKRWLENKAHAAHAEYFKAPADAFRKLSAAVPLHFARDRYWSCSSIQAGAGRMTSISAQRIEHFRSLFDQAMRYPRACRQMHACMSLEAARKPITSSQRARWMWILGFLSRKSRAHLQF